jgi:hypothetical protein
MATKTFKIGEYAKGGIITVIATAKEVTVICKEWDMSTGTRRSSDQSNAKEMYRKSFNVASRDIERDLFMYLTDETTSYYADQIIQWVKTKVKFNQDNWW